MSNESRLGQWLSWLTRSVSELLRKEAMKVLLAIAGIVLIGGLLLLTDFAKMEAREWLNGRRPSEPPVQKGIKVLAVFPESSVSDPMVEGLNVADPTLVPGKDWTLHLLREHGLDATERDLAHRLREDREIVMVVGHERSTTVKFLNERVYESEEFIENGGPIPLLLPAVTNPEITGSPRGGHRHILRLPATDNKQVDRITGLLDSLSPAPQRIVLVVDTSNIEYSSYIARELIAKSLGSSIVDAVGVDISSGGFSPSRFLEARPDTIIFIGMEIEADIFLRRLKEDGGLKEGSEQLKLGRDGLRLIFTDGVAGETFEKIAGRVLAGGDRVFLTGPFPAEAPKGQLTDFPTYEPYAALARNIAVRILEEADRNGGISRESVLRVVQGLHGASTEYRHKNVGAKFDQNGDNLLGLMHVYEIGPSKVWHSDLCTCE